MNEETLKHKREKILRRDVKSCLSSSSRNSSFPLKLSILVSMTIGLVLKISGFPSPWPSSSSGSFWIFASAKGSPDKAGDPSAMGQWSKTRVISGRANICIGNYMHITYSTNCKLLIVRFIKSYVTRFVSRVSFGPSHKCQAKCRWYRCWSARFSSVLSRCNLIWAHWKLIRFRPLYNHQDKLQMTESWMLQCLCPVHSDLFLRLYLLWQKISVNFAKACKKMSCDLEFNCQSYCHVLPE